MLNKDLEHIAYEEATIGPARDHKDNCRFRISAWRPIKEKKPIMYILTVIPKKDKEFHVEMTDVNFNILSYIIELLSRQDSDKIAGIQNKPNIWVKYQQLDSNVNILTVKDFLPTGIEKFQWRHDRQSGRVLATMMNDFYHNGIERCLAITLKQAMELDINQNKTTESLKYYDEVFRLADEESELFRLSCTLGGTANGKCGNNKQARKMLEKAVVLTDDYKTYHNLASAYHNLGMYAERDIVHNSIITNNSQI